MEGTDCRIREPRPFNIMRYSHKFSGSNVCYEIAVSNECGNIVWMHGSFPCGKWPDLKIFYFQDVYATK